MQRLEKITEEDMIKALSDPEEDIKWLIKNVVCFRVAVLRFPQHADALFEKVFSDPELFRTREEFGEFIISIDDFLETAIQFPEHADALIEKVLSNPKIFKWLIENGDDLLKTAKKFPEHADALIEKVLSDSEIFNRLVTNNDDLLATSKQFPDHADALINKVLSDTEVFSRLVKNNDELRETAKQFPNDTILKAENYDIALALVKNRKNQLSQVGIASSTLGQGKRDTANHFSMFPKDVLINIAKHTADPSVLSDDQAHKKAHESFDHPSMRKPKK